MKTAPTLDSAEVQISVVKPSQKLKIFMQTFLIVQGQLPSLPAGYSLFVDGFLRGRCNDLLKARLIKIPYASGDEVIGEMEIGTV